MTIEEKLRLYILDRYKSLREFSLEIDIPYTTVDSIFKRGVSKANVLNIIKICSALGIQAEPLLDGEIVLTPSRLKEEHPLLTKYNSLDAHGQQAVNSILEVELERMQEKEENKVVEIRRKYPIQEYEERVSAGTGNNLDYASAFITELDYEPPKCADFIVRVAGDSMTPTYNDGDRLFVHRTKDFNYGDIGIFFVPQDGLVVKEYTTDGLVSRNKDYKVIKADNGIEYVGKVIGKVK